MLWNPFGRKSDNQVPKTGVCQENSDLEIKSVKSQPENVKQNYTRPSCTQHLEIFHSLLMYSLYIQRLEPKDELEIKTE